MRRTAARLLLALAAWAAVGATAASTAAAALYWVNADDDTIGYLPGLGSPSDQALLTSPRSVGGGVAVDEHHLYWSMWAGGIGRADRDGGSPDPDFVPDADNPNSIAVDDGHVYWTRPNDDRIGRAPLHGGAADNDFIETGSTPEGVVVTPTHVYWANFNDGTIGRADLDGSDADNAFITGLDGPRGLSHDGTHLYWADMDVIGRARLDGTDVDPTFRDVGWPVHSTAVAGGMVYWTEPTMGDIGAVHPASGHAGYVVTSAQWPLGLVATGPSFAVAPAPHDFGSVGVAGSAAQTFTVRNDASGSNAEPLVLSAPVEITGADADQFAVTDDTCSGRSIDPGDACTVTVSYAPTRTGPASAMLGLAGNMGLGTETVALSGRGVLVEVALTPSNLDLGAVAVGDTSAPASATIANIASGPDAGPVTIPADGVTLGGPDAEAFAVDAAGCAGVTLAPGATCTVEVRFAPRAGGARSASLHVAHDAPGSTPPVALTGTGLAPALTLTPADWSFGAVLVGLSAPPAALSVGNGGDAPAVLPAGAVTVTGPGFALTTDGCSGTTIPVGGACTVEVAFDARVAGPASGTLTVDGGPGGMPTAALSATAVGFTEPVGPLAPAPAVHDDGERTPAAPIVAPPGSAGESTAPARARVTRAVVRVDRRGRAHVRLRCRGPVGTSCAGRLRLLDRASARRLSRPKRVRLDLAAGSRSTVVVRLRRAVRRDLAAGDGCRTRRAIVRLSAAAAGRSKPRRRAVVLVPRGCQRR